MIVIVGAGLAAVRAIESMRASGYSGAITLVGDEPHLPYERPPLSKDALRGATPWTDLAIQRSSFYAEHRVELRLGTAAVGLDTERRRVVLADGDALPFEKLLIATGSAPTRLVVRGSELDGILVLRGLDDARALREQLLASNRVVVVGAGLVGLEVASVARAMGKQVVVIERGPHPLDRLLDGHEIATSIRALHEANGVEIRTSTTVVGFSGEKRVGAAILSDGTALTTDLVLVAIGVRPNTAWLEGSGVHTDDGVVVDERAETNVSGVFAAGDVARMRTVCGTIRLETYGHAHSHGIAVGRTLAGMITEYRALAAASSEQYGVRLQFLGSIRRDGPVVVRGERSSGTFAAFVLEGSRVTGAFTMNRPKDALLARRLIESQAPVLESDFA